MNLEKIKEYQLKAEGFSEGVKWGVTQTLQWLIVELEKEKSSSEKNSSQS